MRSLLEICLYDGLVSKLDADDTVTEDTPVQGAIVVLSIIFSKFPRLGALTQLGCRMPR